MRPTKPSTPRVRAVKPAGGRAAEKPATKHTGTNTEAFYAAQKEAAADSREYAARRRQR
jgi:hypothetical protein